MKIGEAARMLGTSPGTLRKWEASGEITPARKSKGGTRYYAVEDLAGLNTSELPTLAYARVSSHDQKADLDRQHAMLEAYCAAKGWRSEIIRDLGSGMNYNKKGMDRDINAAVNILNHGEDTLKPTRKRTSESSKTACGIGADGVNEILIDSLDYVRL